MAKSTSSIKASWAYPAIYRVILTTVEPIFAVCGAGLVFWQPATYMSSMTRSVGVYTSDSKYLYTALGGSWLYFAFIEAVLLRLLDDARVWRVLCLGMLLSDAAFCLSVVEGVGGWQNWLRLSTWTMDDWVALATTAPMVLVRILIVLGLGVRKTRAKRA